MTSKIVRADLTVLDNIRSVVYREQVNADTDLRPGCVASAYIEVECHGSQSDAPSAGEALTYYQVDGSGSETLIGVFYAEPSIPTRKTFKFTAYDAVAKMDVDFSAWLTAHQNDFPMSIYSLVSAACGVAGVTLGSASWPLSTQTVNAFYADNITCRAILQYAAEIACRFVRCNAAGEVIFDWYTVKSGYKIYPGSGSSGGVTYVPYKQGGMDYENYDTAALDAVCVHPVGEDDTAYIYPSEASGNALHVRNNALLYGASSSDMMAIAQNIYTEMRALGVYRPMTAKLFPSGNPFRAGDIVSVEDIQGVAFTSVVMGLTVSASEAIAQATGHRTYDDAASSIQKALVQLAADIVRISKLKVDWAEIDTAVIDSLEANGINADDITVTGTLHSADYVRTGSPYADVGIGIELDTKRIAATNFGITPQGHLYARQGMIADATLGRAVNRAYVATFNSFLDTNGTASQSYTYNSSTYTLTAGENGTVVYTVPVSASDSEGTYALNKVWCQCKSGGNETEEWNTPSGRIIYLSSGGTTLYETDYAGLRYMASASTSGVTYTLNPEYVSQAASVRVEIDVANGDTCRMQRWYGVYAAIYYGSASTLRGASDGVYFGSDGISVGEDIVLTPDGHASIDTLTANSGDFTGRIRMISEDITDGVAPAANTWGKSLGFKDAGNENYLGVIQPFASSVGRQGLYIAGYQTVNGTRVNNSVYLLVDSTGAQYVGLTSPEAWRTALNLSSAAGDSGWQTLELNAAFALYNASYPVKYRKIGSMVELRGTIKPSSQIAAGGTATIGTLNVGYRPDYARNYVCQGSGQNRWLLTINYQGVIGFERYGGDTAIAVPTTAWLPFAVTFFADN